MPVLESPRTTTLKLNFAPCAYFRRISLSILLMLRTRYSSSVMDSGPAGVDVSFPMARKVTAPGGRSTESRGVVLTQDRPGFANPGEESGGVAGTTRGGDARWSNARRFHDRGVSSMPARERVCAQPGANQHFFRQARPRLGP